MLIGLTNFMKNLFHCLDKIKITTFIFRVYLFYIQHQSQAKYVLTLHSQLNDKMFDYVTQLF